MGYDAYGRDILSIACWQAQALWMCRETGFQQRPKITATVRNAVKYIESTQNAGGGFGETDRTNSFNQLNLSGAALASLQELKPEASRAGGYVPDKTARAALRWIGDEIKKSPPDWSKDCLLYTWYFNSLSLNKAGSETWQLWWRSCESSVLTNQSPDGSWKTESMATIAPIGPDLTFYDRDILRACLAILILDTPVRYRVK
jgi:hypothetical protein